MPKNKVRDPITDQEIAFARLVLAGTMTDRHAAEAVGLNPRDRGTAYLSPRTACNSCPFILPGRAKAQTAQKGRCRGQAMCAGVRTIGAYRRASRMSIPDDTFAFRSLPSVLVFLAALKLTSGKSGVWVCSVQ
jgi:hypothetical protein